MRWIWYLVAAVWALDALRMRVRLRSIPALPPAGPLPAGGYGAISAGVEVDDGTRAAANPLASWPSFSALVGRSSRFAFAIQLLTLTFLAVGLWIVPAAGMTALAIFHLQPLVVFAGLPLRPRDLGRMTLLRGPLDAWNCIQLIRSWAAMPAAPREHMEALERAYAERLKNGIEAFFDPRRETCPICESPHPKPFLRTTDLIQRKPGRFVLDKCVA